jgi:serine/threonine protein kinase
MQGKLSVYTKLETISETNTSIVEKVIDPIGLGVYVIKRLDYHQQQPWYNEVHILMRLSGVRGASQYINHIIKPNGELDILMDYVQGVPLENILVHTTPKYTITHYIAVSLARTLREAHGLGIRHGDIKPDNIIVSSNPYRVTLVDWGYAIEPDRLHKSISYTAGSYMYMCPELCRSHGSYRPHISDDVWSYGIILYELITGVYPYYCSGGADDLLYDIATRYPEYTPNLESMDSLKSLFDGIFLPRRQRLTMEQVVDHPWITSGHGIKRQRSLSV